MDDDVFVQLVPLPYKTTELITPCLDGYTVYLNSRLTREQNLESYYHAIRHIRDGAFDMDKIGADVDEIEARTHKED